MKIRISSISFVIFVALGSFGLGNIPSASAQALKTLRPWSPAWMDYCSQRYRSFNRRTGYYTTYTGKNTFCVAKVRRFNSIGNYIQFGDYPEKTDGSLKSWQDCVNGAAGIDGYFANECED